MAGSRKKDVDSGWAWVVLLASYMNLFILSGVCYMGGMFQVVFLERFQESVSFTSWVTSLFASLMLFAGPLTSVITSYTNCRVSVMLGGILMAGGLLVSTYMTSLLGMFLSFGVVAGLGLGLGYTPSVVVVNFFFERRRTLVTSVALSASGTGLLVAPLLFRFLLDNFAWQECLIILAGICLHVSLFGALMFPIHEKSSRSNCLFKCGKEQSDADDPDLHLTENLINQNGKSGEKQTTLNGDIHTNRSDKNTSNGDVNKDSIFKGVISTDKNIPSKHNIDINGKGHNATNGIHNETILDDNSRYTERDFKTSLLEISPTKIETSAKTSPNKGGQMDIFKNKAFVVFCLNQFLVNAGCGVFNIHIPALCKSYGSTTQQIAWVLSVNGPANIVSRVLLGAFAQASGDSVWILYIGVILISGAMFCLIPLIAQTYVTQLIAVVLIGTYLGGSYSLPPVLTIDCVGLDRLACAFGVEMICCGSAWLVAPPIAGWFVDITGSYDYSMYLAGFMMFLSVLVGLCIPRLLKPENKHYVPVDITEVVDKPQHSAQETLQEQKEVP